MDEPRQHADTPGTQRRRSLPVRPRSLRQRRHAAGRGQGARALPAPPVLALRQAALFD